MATHQKQSPRVVRHRRVRSKIRGTKECPRLSVYRSNKNMMLQLIDDDAGKTLIAVSTAKLGGSKATKSDKALAAGKLLAEKAREQKISKIVFDRGGFRYHGRVE